jgi:TPP-dependent pyruvate/acetoin dehydrogenase alpha subunit
MAATPHAELGLSPDEARELGLDRPALLAAFRHMVLTRAVEDRGKRLFKAGRLPGSFYTGRGNEAASVGVALAMGEHDVAAPLHRNMGVHVTRGVPLWRIFAQYMGRDGGATRGRDSNLRTQDLSPGRGLLAGVSHLPAMLPVITGVALAFQLRREPRVALGWCGDGAAARADAHESMNLAGVRRLPIVYLIDNNQFAYSTPTRLSYACERLSDRAAAYGFEGVTIDATDVLAVLAEARRAVEKARMGGGPTLIELVTLRLEGHAIHDDAGYVPRELFEHYAARDPVERYRAWLELNDVAGAEELGSVEAEVAGEVEQAVQRAEMSPWPDPAQLLDGVYAD